MFELTFEENDGSPFLFELSFELLDETLLGGQFLFKFYIFCFTMRVATCFALPFLTGRLLFVIFEFVAEMVKLCAKSSVISCDLVILLEQYLVFLIFGVDLALKTFYKLQQQAILLL